MVSEKCVAAFFLLQLCWAGCGFCSKVLVWPCDMSHWLNLKTILEELGARGHEVTVLKYPSIIIDQSKRIPLHFENIPLLYEIETAENRLNEIANLAVNVIPNLSLWEAAKTLQDFFLQVTGDFESICRSVLYNQKFMDKLRDAQYDVVVIDPVVPCGELVAEVLQIPFVYTLRFSMGYYMEKHCGQLPIPLSYVPVVMSELTDNMTFTERVKNMMFSLLFEYWLQQYDFAFWDQFYSETLGKSFHTKLVVKCYFNA
jgi:glucuronosyltransferase